MFCAAQVVAPSPSRPAVCGVSCLRHYLSRVDKSEELFGSIDRDAIVEVRVLGIADGMSDAIVEVRVLGIADGISSAVVRRRCRFSF